MQTLIFRRLSYHVPKDLNQVITLRTGNTEK